MPAHLDHSFGEHDPACAAIQIACGRGHAARRRYSATPSPSMTRHWHRCQPSNWQQRQTAEPSIGVSRQGENSELWSACSTMRHATRKGKKGRGRPVRTVGALDAPRDGSAAVGLGENKLGAVGDRCHMATIHPPPVRRHAVRQTNAHLPAPHAAARLPSRLSGIGHVPLSATGATECANALQRTSTHCASQWSRCSCGVTPAKRAVRVYASEHTLPRNAAATGTQGTQGTQERTFPRNAAARGGHLLAYSRP